MPFISYLSLFTTYESNSLYSLDLYANWDSKVTSGTVVPEKKYKGILSDVKG